LCTNNSGFIIKFADYSHIKNQKKSILTFSEAKQKLEYFCSYQERCHKDIESKLFEMQLTTDEKSEIIIHLLDQNFLNETRFACSFARGKHRIKSWGKIRIINELKFRGVSSYNITLALKEISETEYFETFDKIANRHWETIRESDVQKKKKKWGDYLLRKGWESSLVFERMREV
jgi:regulatory protein